MVVETSDPKVIEPDETDKDDQTDHYDEADTHYRTDQYNETDTHDLTDWYDDTDTDNLTDKHDLVDKHDLEDKHDLANKGYEADNETDNEAGNDDETIFHPLLRLPCELRVQVWEAAAVSYPRDLIVLKTRKQAKHLIHGYKVVASPLSIVQVCWESRRVGTRIYEKAFQDGPRYLWVNFDIDTIQIDCDSIIADFPDRLKVQHIRGVYRDQPGRLRWDGTQEPMEENPFEGYCNLKTVDILSFDYDLSYCVEFANNPVGCHSMGFRVISYQTGEHIDHTNLEEWLDVTEFDTYWDRQDAFREQRDFGPVQFIPWWNRHRPIID
ncbi:hypothetical protein F5X68DRAFT_190426 [Plectosphaerella plurivora]|uniref:2EXR domain-containing protein n=1 Tax=Plectosphaerella plurivora TaxID=936078 RepID=A0A9P8VBT9_9PEZI|nr:hypothetical protein F5X68DRAFT_190426 [Plectosphaerella plurivora]